MAVCLILRAIQSLDWDSFKKCDFPLNRSDKMNDKVNGNLIELDLVFFCRHSLPL